MPHSAARAARVRSATTHGAAWTAAGLALSTVATFAANGVVVALATPEVFADLAVMTVALTIYGCLFRFGTDRVFVGEVHQAGVSAGAAHGRRVGGGLLASVVLLAAIGALALTLTPLGLPLEQGLSRGLTGWELVLVGAWFFSDTVRLVCAEAHRAGLRFRLAVLSGFGARAPLFLLLVVAVATLGEDGLSRLEVFGCAALASTAVMLVAIAAAAPHFPWWRQNPLRALRHTSSGRLPMVLMTLAGAAIGGADVWIVGATMSAEDTARYGFAVTVAAGIAVLSTALNGGLAPFLARALAERDAGEEADVAQLQGFAVRMVRLAAAAAVVLYAGIVLLGERVAVWLGGEAYDGVLTLLVVLTAGQVVSTAAGISGYVLTVGRRYRVVATTTVTVASLAVALELVAGFVLSDLLLLTLVSGAATAALPVVNNVASARLLGFRTDVMHRQA